jgi:hypothetical protein
MAAAETQTDIGSMSDGQLTRAANPLVRLKVFNTVGMPATTLTDAEAEATDVYRAAGVTLVWSESPVASSLATSSEPAVDLRIIVVGGAAERRLIDDGRLADTVLGFAPTRRNCFCGRNAYIFSERIMALGYQRGNPTTLLGRVLAHEVGHLLLSRDSHSPTGIMRATLDTELSVRPRFADDEVKALQRGLARLRSN